MAVYEIVLRGAQGSDDALTVLHYDVTGTTPLDFQAVADVFRVQLVDELQAFLYGGMVYSGIDVRLDEPGQLSTYYPFTLGQLAGGDTDDGQVKQVAMMVRKLTTSSVRPVQGRLYQAGVSSQHIGQGAGWQLPARTAVTAFWENVRVIDFAGPSQARMVIKASNPTAPNTQPYTFVSGVNTSDNPVTLKRRKTGRGS